MNDGNTITETNSYGPEESTWVYHPGPGWHSTYRVVHLDYQMVIHF